MVHPIHGILQWMAYLRHRPVNRNMMRWHPPHKCLQKKDVPVVVLGCSKTAAILVTTLENEVPRVLSDFPIRSSSAVPSFSTTIFKAFAKMNTLGSADGHWFAVVTFWSDESDEAVVSYLGTGTFFCSFVCY